MWLEQLTRDFRFACRALVKSPSFSIVAIVSLAVALGANTAVFAFARAIVMKTLPAPGADRFVILRQHNEMFHMENCCFTYQFFTELRKHDLGFEDVFGTQDAEVNLTDQDQTEKLTAELVSGNYCRMLGVHAALGRLIDESDDATEGSRVCVISYRLWQERFGGRGDILRRRVVINTTPFQIIGVTERGFAGATVHEAHDLELPSSAVEAVWGAGRSAVSWVAIIGQLKPGVTVAQETARLNSVGIAIQEQLGFHPAANDTFRLEDGTQGINSKKAQFGKPVLLLFVLVGVVLIVACANLTALLLVRSVERTREAGVRLALGGSRAGLVRRFLAESVLLAIVAGIAGWGLAQLLTGVLLKMLGSDGEGLVRQVRPDSALFAFSAALTLTAGIVFGFLPAWRAALCDPIEAIRGKSSPRNRWMASRILIVAQIALSLALLFGAGLFIRTLHNLRSIDVGFNPENIALLRVDLSRTTLAKNTKPFFEELLRRARELPGTRAASVSTIGVLSGAMARVAVRIPGYAPPNGLFPTSYVTVVSGGYFRTLGIPLLAGRDFTSDDRAGANRVVIVNEQFAREFLQGDALGKAFIYGGMKEPVGVIGIAGNAHFRRLREETQPVLYIPITQVPFDSAYLQVRSSRDPAVTIARLRSLVRDLDPRVPIDEATTMEMQIEQALARERLLAFLSTLMGGIAVLLAAIGLYGVMSFSVARRTREIGIRMAIGAQRSAILVQFLKESAAMVALGLALGVPLALGCGKLAVSLLYGLQPADIATAVAATAILALIAFAAAWIPARRASRLDPMAALRWE